MNTDKRDEGGRGEGKGERGKKEDPCRHTVVHAVEERQLASDLPQRGKLSRLGSAGNL